MASKLIGPLRRVLRQLEARKEHIDRVIMAVREALTALGGAGRESPSACLPGKAVRRRRMSAAARQAVSRRMKVYWAKRRAAAVKRESKGGPKGR
jgi:hypothetical protein